MRIAFLHPDLGLGGAERLVVDAALRLRAAGHEAVIFTAHHDRARCFPETRDGRLALHVRGGFLPAHIGQRLRAPCAIARMAYLAATPELRRNAFDVVVCDLVSHAVPLLRLLTSVPIVFYCHFPDLFLTPPRHRWMYRAYRTPLDRLEPCGLRLADRVLVNSRFTAQRLQEAFPDQGLAPEVLYPGVDIGDYAREPDDGPAEHTTAMILSVARYARAKNLALAVDTFAALRRQLAPATFAPLRLVLAGGYDERLQECRDTLAELQARARAAGIAERVEFQCSVTDAERLRLYARCRYVIHTAEHEHFGFVPLEAMAAARPVIAVDSGGTRETIRHGSTGLLCPPSPTAFAAALASLIESPQTAERMGRAGRAHVAAHFSLRVFGERLEGILRDVVGGRPAQTEAS